MSLVPQGLRLPHQMGLIDRQRRTANPASARTNLRLEIHALNGHEIEMLDVFRSPQWRPFGQFGRVPGRTRREAHICHV
jgi:hypothetical protein